MQRAGTVGGARAERDTGAHHLRFGARHNDGERPCIGLDKCTVGRSARGSEEEGSAQPSGGEAASDCCYQRERDDHAAPNTFTWLLLLVLVFGDAHSGVPGINREG